MYKSKLFQVLSKLTKKELKNFELFVSSPFHNQDLKLKDFYIQLKFYISQQAEVDKKAVFLKIYPQKTYNDTLFRLNQSQLFRLLESYLILEHSTASPIQDQQTLLAFYRMNQLWKPYHSTLNKILKDHDPNGRLGEQYLEDSTILNEEQINFQSLQKGIKPDLLQKFYDQRNQIFLIKILRTACRLLTERSVYNYTFDLGYLPSIIQWISEKSDPMNPIVELYLAYYKMLQDPKEEFNYENFSKLLSQHSNLFSLQELRELYLAAHNYCIKKVNQGHRHYQLLALNNYIDALNKEVLFEHGYLSQRTYNNIVALALKSNQWEWVEDFMEQYTTHLLPGEQEGTYHLNHARLAYVKGDLGQALELLQGADFKPMLNNLSAKTLMIKLFYETDELDVLHYQLKAMKAFLYRNKVMGYHKKAFNNLIKYTEKLLRLHKGDNKKIEKIKTAIQEEEIIWEKPWLLNQLDLKI